MKASTAAAITGLTLASAVVGYAAYFDYRRRHDANFRRSLGKQYKRQKKAEAKKDEENKKASETAIAAAVASTRAALADGTIPKDPATREAYFMEQISIGELLFNRGADFHLDSATAFFRALKVYPQPFELLIILGKTVPPEVNTIIMKMVEKDVLLSEGENPSAAASASIRTDEVDDEAPSAPKTEAEGEKKEEEPKEEQEKKEEEPKEATKPESVSGSTNEWDVVSATSDKPAEESTIGKGFGAAAEPAASTAPVHFSFGTDKPAESETPKAEEQAEKPAEESEAPKEEPAAPAPAPAQEEAAPQPEEPVEEAPKVEEPAKEEPVEEAPKVEEPAKEEPAAEEPKAEEAKAEEPAKEETKDAEPAQQESAVAEVKEEAPKAESTEESA